jgi:CheY-like chemotaxis protein
MTDQFELLTRQLRELLVRLRRVAEIEKEVGKLPTSLPRVMVATRLLANCSYRAQFTEFSTVLQALLNLLQWLQNHPGSRITHCEQVLQDVIEFEEMLLARLDEGEELRALITAERLDLLAEGFGAILEDSYFPRDIIAWPGTEAEEEPARSDVAVEAAPGGRVLLLMSDSLRARQLEGILDEAGFGTALCGRPGDVLEQLEAEAGVRAVVCDNSEPECRMQKLVGLLQGTAPIERPRLVLITASRVEGRIRRARLLGADAVWSPPYATEEFRNTLVTT